MSLRVALDLDGVLADFRTGFSLVAGQVLSQSHRDPDSELTDFSDADTQKVWKVITETPNWWLTLKPYEPQEIARLYRLSRELKWEIFFMTARIPTAGESVLFQSQWWLEAQGFYLPSVMTVLGSRGELANSLRLDLIVDDQLINCAEVIAASQTKAVCMMRKPQAVARDQAINAGIGVLETLADTIDVLQRLHRLTPDRRRSLTKLSEWFFGRTERPSALPVNPRSARPLEGVDRPQD